VESRNNDRVGLQILIDRYRELASRTTDEPLLRGIKQQIAALEQQLSEMDDNEKPGNRPGDQLR
jgi:hypothetical protein